MCVCERECVGHNQLGGDGKRRMATRTLTGIFIELENHLPVRNGTNRSGSRGTLLPAFLGRGGGGRGERLIVIRRNNDTRSAWSTKVTKSNRYIKECGKNVPKFPKFNRLREKGII